jgi:hypothetical protein
MAAAHRVRALAGAQVYIAARQRETDDQAELAAARGSFRALVSLAQLDAPGRAAWTGMEVWAGNRTGALEHYGAALAQAPDDQALLDEMTTTARLLAVSDLAAARLAGRSDALGLWYRGRARYESAFQAPANADTDRAIGVIAAAIDDVRAAAGR